MDRHIGRYASHAFRMTPIKTGSPSMVHSASGRVERSPVVQRQEDGTAALGGPGDSLHLSISSSQHVEKAKKSREKLLDLIKEGFGELRPLEHFRIDIQTDSGQDWLAVEALNRQEETLGHTSNENMSNAPSLVDDEMSESEMSNDSHNSIGSDLEEAITSPIRMASSSLLKNQYRLGLHSIRELYPRGLPVVVARDLRLRSTEVERLGKALNLTSYDAGGYSLRPNVGGRS